MLKIHSKLQLLAFLLGFTSANAQILSFEEAKSQADSGDARSQAIVAMHYSLGWQTSKSPEKAVEYALKSARTGEALGLFRMGTLLRNGEGVSKNEEEGLKLQLEAIKLWNNQQKDRLEKGDPYCQLAAGILIFQGKVVDDTQQNRYNIAAQLYRKAADKGLAPAEFNYAMCLLEGHGVTKDGKKASEMLASAVRNGYGPAIDFLKKNGDLALNDSTEKGISASDKESQKDQLDNAVSLLAQGLPVEAINKLNDIINNDSTNLSAYELRGYAYFINGEWKLSADDFNYCIKNSNDDNSKWLYLWRWAANSKNKGKEIADNELKDILENKKIEDKWWNRLATGALKGEKIESLIPETKKSDPKIEKARILDVYFYMGIIPNIAYGNEVGNEQIYPIIKGLGNIEYTEQIIVIALENKFRLTRNTELSSKISDNNYKNLESFLESYDTLLNDKLLLPEFEKEINPIYWADDALSNQDIIAPGKYIEAMRNPNTFNVKSIAKVEEIKHS